MADTSIYSNLLRPPKSVAEYDAEAQQAKANKLSLLLQQGQYDAQQRGVADEQRMNSFYQNSLNPDGSLDRAKLLTSVAGGGLGSRIPALQKQFLEMDKTQAEVGEKKADTTKKTVEADAVRFKTAQSQLEAIYNAASGARDQQSYTMALQGLQQAGIDISQLPQQFDPAYVQNAQAQALTALQRLEQQMKQRQQAEVERSNRADEATAVGNLRVAQGNLGLRSKELQFQQTKDGLDRKEKAAGGGKTGAPTEGERKAATLLQRMRGSMAQLEAALGEDAGAAKPGLMAEAIRSVPLIGGDTPANLVTSQTRQRAEAAQLDILDAALTLGTGAAYTKEQLRGYAKSYFPQIGDDAKTVKDKQARLANVIRAAEVAADRADPQPRSTGGASGSWNGWSIQEVK